VSKDINNCFVLGNLTKDVELKYTKNGTPVCNFSIANNQDYSKDGKEIKQVNFFDIQCWNNLSEVCNKYLKKGNKIAVEGQLKQDRWMDDSGNKKSKIMIIANNIQFLNTKNEENQGNKPENKPNNNNSGQSGNPFKNQSSQPEPEENENSDIDNSIPF